MQTFLSDKVKNKKTINNFEYSFFAREANQYSGLLFVISRLPEMSARTETYKRKYNIFFWKKRKKKVNS
jgi:hypothetical protein